MLIAFDVSLELVRLVRRLLPVLARRDQDLASQIRRATNSIALNIAEGDGRAGKDERRHFGYARGSAKEVHGALQVTLAWGHLSTQKLQRPLDLALEIVRMLSPLTGR